MGACNERQTKTRGDVQSASSVGSSKPAWQNHRTAKGYATPAPHSPRIPPSRPTKQRIIKRRMHAPAPAPTPSSRQPATRPEPRPKTRPQRIVWPQTRRVEVVFADIERIAPRAHEPTEAYAPARRAADLVFVLEARGREVTGGWEGWPGGCGEGVGEGVWTGGGREVVGAEGIEVVGRALALALSARGGGGRGGVFVAFLLDAGGEFLQDGELEEGGEVGDAAGGEEEGFELPGRRRFGLSLGRAFVWVR